MPAEPVEADGIDVLAYTDVAGRPPFKLALREAGERWYLYTGHLWHRGWSILDVTDPTRPSVVGFVEGPANTWTAQVAVADELLLTALARIPPQWGGRVDQPFDETAIVWDLSDPVVPRELSRIRFGGTGSHRNAWPGGRYAHLAANVPGFRNYIHVTVDLSDPATPREVGRWWAPGQREDEELPSVGQSLHGPAVIENGIAYLPYGGAGLVLLDMADVGAPREVGRLPVSPPFLGGLYGTGVHSALPLPGRELVVIDGEAHAERCAEALSIAGIVDVTDPTAPRLISTLPLPVPPTGLPYRSYCDKGGRFGPHNLHLPQGRPELESRDDIIYLTWFNAGLRVYDVSEARAPREVARFVPGDPTHRYGPLPASGLVAQSEDVLVDRRGVIYLSDKNQGLYLLRLRASPA